MLNVVNEISAEKMFNEENIRIFPALTQIHFRLSMEVLENNTKRQVLGKNVIFLKYINYSLKVLCL